MKREESHVLCQCGGPRKGCVCNSNAVDNGDATGLDPVTYEPLEGEHPRHPHVVSKDGKVTLCYNERTLRRIALEAGKWMQPPHFRTVMEPELVSLCEEIGGSLERDLERYDREGRRTRIEETEFEEAFYVEMNANDEIFENFTGKLSMAKVFVCPSCFKRLQIARDKNDKDPLDVFTDVGFDCVGLFSFLGKKKWAKHMEEAHGMGREEINATAEDCLLKQMIYTWLNGKKGEDRR